MSQLDTTHPTLSKIQEELRQILGEAFGSGPAPIPEHVPIFDLGVASLALVDALRRVYDRLGVLVSVRQVFDGQMSMSVLALYIEERLSSPSAGQHEAPDAGAEAGSPPALAQTRSSDWGRERMAFLQREAELPGYIRPGRGARYHDLAEASTVLLTGATGFPGIHIVAEILGTTRAHLYCLVRPKRGETGLERIEKELRRFDLWSEDEAWQTAWRDRLEAVEGDVSLPRLGLPDEIYEALAREVEVIIHGAAHVNFIYPYEALRDTNVLGLHELIRFAFHARIKAFHHLSTAGIWPMGTQRTFYENDPIDHGDRLILGYHEAKWVGERCLLHAADRGLPLTRYRPGEIGGHSRTGRCDTEHVILASFKGFLEYGAFPRLEFALDVAPVDYIAQAMTYLAVRKNVTGRAFHLTNPSPCPMSEGLAYLRDLGYRFQEVAFEELLDTMRRSPDFTSNAVFPYEPALREMDSLSLRIPLFDTSETLRALEGSGISCPPTDRQLLMTYWHYLQSVGFIPRPEQQPATA
jgi:thioester reductase-like protein